MTTVSLSKPPPCLYGHSNPIRSFSTPVILSLSFHRTEAPIPMVCCALKTESEGSNLLRKPVSPTARELGGISEQEDDDADEAKYRKESDEDIVGEEEEDDDEWVDWEDQILEDTVPLVGFVRMILHSGKYEIGERLSPDHERTIVDRLLPYHPECEKKIGCGIDYITVGYHPDFTSSRCLFIIRKDGQSVDFSYWKCIKGLIRKNYPLYADTFILRHFRRQRRN
ncbi:unnamed protein product [Linum trigynum]|uniref:Protein DCL, chloroplastic n=1 Tax=Linum trigynum TaxID=586398 RepID=A0AAV2FCR9_9ROSI